MHSRLAVPGRCAVLGVLNVTSDSFSDGGRYLDHGAAVRHAEELVEAGADIVDVGGESTRPGAERVASEEELERVLPVVRELVARGITVSVDTMRARVAEKTLEAGAAIVNDVSGGLADPDMVRVVAEADVPYMLMHWRGHSRDMNELARYDDVVTDVRDELTERVEAAVKAGVDESGIVLDPGLGFAKTGEHDWQLLNRLGVLLDLGYPVLVGASRKRFLGRLLADAEGNPRPPAGRETATAAISALSADRGAWGVRVHDVRASRDAIAVSTAWKAGAA
ncbi:dihydropteroate synthase [Bounagaea algeriensis]